MCQSAAQSSGSALYSNVSLCRVGERLGRWTSPRYSGLSSRIFCLPESGGDSIIREDKASSAARYRLWSAFFVVGSDASGKTASLDAHVDNGEYSASSSN